MKPKYRKVNMCEWCIAGDRSHGVKIYVGDYVGTFCESCGDASSYEVDETVHECLVED